MRQLVAVVGPTATGKTALAIDLAKQFGGEIVNADSCQIYQHLNIGTAKPSPEEQLQAQHHLISVADPREQFNLARFLELAHSALNDIWKQGRQPLLAGGAGQYIWALLEGWQVPRLPPQPELRNQLEARAKIEGAQKLHMELRQLDPDSADRIDPRNVRRVVRALEIHEATGQPLSHWRKRKRPSFQSLIIGLDMPKELLHKRIDNRVDKMIENGFVAEVQGLLSKGYSAELPSLSGIGYRQICHYLAGESSLIQAIEQIKVESYRLARQQRSWFKQTDKRIFWLHSGKDATRQARKIVSDFLQLTACS